MKVTHKHVKNGTEVTYSCTKCGVVYANYVVGPGESVDVNWSKSVPMVCTCGEQLLEEVITLVPRVVELVGDQRCVMSQELLLLR
jgi:uncharacterized Zn finger protein